MLKDQKGGLCTLDPALLLGVLWGLRCSHYKTPGTGEQRRQSRRRGQLQDEELKEEEEGRRRETQQELMYWFFSWHLGFAEHVSMLTAGCLSRLKGLYAHIGCWKHQVLLILQLLRRLVTNKHFSNSSTTNSPFSIPRYTFQNLGCFKSGKKKGKIRSGVPKGKRQNTPISTAMFSSGKDKAFEPSKQQNYYFSLEQQ